MWNIDKKYSFLIFLSIIHILPISKVNYIHALIFVSIIHILPICSMIIKNIIMPCFLSMLERRWLKNAMPYFLYFSQQKVRNSLYFSSLDEMWPKNRKHLCTTFEGSLQIKIYLWRWSIFIRIIRRWFISASPDGSL